MVDRSTITKTMKKFQITDANNTPIAIAKLDAEAAAFWNKPVDEKYYAYPFTEEVAPENATMKERIQIEMHNAQLSQLNWFEIIGWNIANQGDYTSGWNNVIHTMMAESLGTAILGREYKVPEFEDTDHNEKLHLPVNVEERIYNTLQYFKPFVELIRHWESRGYKPVALND